MQEYVRRRQATIEEYIAKRLIYDLCTGEERLQGTSQLMWWWYQDHIRAEGDNGAIGEEEGKVE